MVGDDLLLSAAFPTTAARPDARIVLASSPLTTDGAFYRNAMSGLGANGNFARTHKWVGLTTKNMDATKAWRVSTGSQHGCAMCT